MIIAFLPVRSLDGCLIGSIERAERSVIKTEGFLNSDNFQAGGK